jgi:hypothetical protein
MQAYINLYKAQKYLGYRMEMGIFDDMPHLRLCILSTLVAVSLWRLSAAIKASIMLEFFLN